jgi:guanine deaminase
MDFAQRAIDLARQNVAEGGRPFATVIAKDGEILAESANKVAQTHDPTAHAEILAIRQACQKQRWTSTESGGNAMVATGRRSNQDP